MSSELALPGLIAVKAEAGPAEVTICQRSVDDALKGAEKVGPTWQLAGERFLLRIPGIARFLLTGGQQIAFQTEGDTPREDIAIFLVGTAFGILLHQRRHVALHAGAVEVCGKAVLFCGPSGAGKSTLTAALVQRGYKLVTDDFCGIDLADVPRVQPDGRQLKLWAQAIEALGFSAGRGEPVRRRIEKYYVEPGHSAVGDALPIGAVYVLRDARPPYKAGIEQPSAVDAALLVRRNAYRPLLVTRMGQQADYFAAATAIAAAAGVFHLTRDLDFAALPDTIIGLERHWREIGLAERAA
ncbi:MAG TPA: hypothetical protein VM782_15875 [Stellaceae bacterium]|nr:hypothetical protein [Stellaceae bacterium]